jgi:hypothetical protein
VDKMMVVIVEEAPMYEFAFSEIKPMKEAFTIA